MQKHPTDLLQFSEFLTLLKQIEAENSLIVIFLMLFFLIQMFIVIVIIIVI